MARFRMKKITDNTSIQNTKQVSKSEVSAKSVVQTFISPEFGQVRTLTENGVTLFCGRDVGIALGYKRPNEAITKHCTHTSKRRIGIQTGVRKNGAPIMQNIGVLLVPESDVYRLISHSKLPNATQFRRWIFEEVLPSIRKHGAYMTPERVDQILANPEITVQLAAKLKEERKQRKLLEAERNALQNQIKADQPKVEFANRVSDAKSCVTAGEFAKFLYDKRHLKIGRNRLLRWMRKHGFLMENNVPYQKYIERGLFASREEIEEGKPGSAVMITGKGQLELFPQICATYQKNA